MNIKPEDISKEHLDKAYEMVKEFCDKNGMTVKEFVSNDLNVEKACEEVHKQLPFALKFVFTKNKIRDMIVKNMEFIRAEALRREG